MQGHLNASGSSSSSGPKRGQVTPEPNPEPQGRRAVVLAINLIGWLREPASRSPLLNEAQVRARESRGPFVFTENESGRGRGAVAGAVG